MDWSVLLILVSLSWGFIALGLYLDRDRRHQNCRWYLRWRKHPCYACIWKMEQELES